MVYEGLRGVELARRRQITMNERGVTHEDYGFYVMCFFVLFMFSTIDTPVTNGDHRDTDAAIQVQSLTEAVAQCLSEANPADEITTSVRFTATPVGYVERYTSGAEGRHNEVWRITVDGAVHINGPRSVDLNRNGTIKKKEKRQR